MASRGTVVATTAAVAGLVGIALGWRLSSSSSRKQRAPAFRDDDAWIALAWQQLIHRKLPPQQSNFRVVAVVAFVRSTHGPIEYVVGHNDESCSLTNSCCGERWVAGNLGAVVRNADARHCHLHHRRHHHQPQHHTATTTTASTNSGAPSPPRAAFLQLAALKGPEAAVVAVYIVTDLGVACTPGCLCREYMSSSELTRPDVPIIMEGRDGPHTRSVIELGDFWPHASPYTGLDAPAQVALGERISPLVRHAGGPCHPGTLDTPKAQRAMAPETWETAVFKCHATAVSAARGDARDDLHPVSCAYDDKQNAKQIGLSQRRTIRTAPDKNSCRMAYSTGAQTNSPPCPTINDFTAHHPPPNFAITRYEWVRRWFSRIRAVRARTRKRRLSECASRPNYHTHAPTTQT